MYNQTMKKTKLVLLPLVFCLTGCLSIRITKESHEEGLFGDSGQMIVGDFSYAPYSGGSFEKTEYTASEITSKISTSTLEFNNEEDIKNYFYDTDGMISSIIEFSYVARNYHGFRIGDAKKDLRGEITFNLTKTVSAVEIEAYPFIIDHDDLSGASKTLIDEDVQLEVNNLGFLKVNSTFEEEPTTTVCSYKLSTPTENIKITCGRNRAVISKIIFYC